MRLQHAPARAAMGCPSLKTVSRLLHKNHPNDDVLPGESLEEWRVIVVIGSLFYYKVKRMSC